MVEIQRRIISQPAEAGYVSDDAFPAEPDWDVVDEWKPEPATEQWSDWEPVESTDDEHPTYYAEHNRDGGLFRAPTLRALNPHIRRTAWFERKLIRRWVDPEHGPMAEVVKVDRRSERV